MATTAATITSVVHRTAMATATVTITMSMRYVDRLKARCVKARCGTIATDMVNAGFAIRCLRGAQTAAP
jgi:hypothetical protein